jgi:phosphoribosyl 1,2-cyclic phosphate phosphodiesterase
VRTRCGALIDRHIKIDLPPDTNLHLLRDGLDARDWSLLVFTHSHDDHFALNEIQYGLYPFNDDEALGYTIFGNDTVCGRIEAAYPDWPLDLERTNAFETKIFGEYSITPILANHKEDEEAHNLLFFDGERTLLYATDTGVWGNASWQFLADVSLDGLVIECTEGIVDSGYSGHLNLVRMTDMVQRLRAEGILKRDAYVCTTHHSHNGDMTYSELADALEPYGIEAGYDGHEFSI